MNRFRNNPSEMENDRGTIRRWKQTQSFLQASNWRPPKESVIIDAGDWTSMTHRIKTTLCAGEVYNTSADLDGYAWTFGWDSDHAQAICAFEVIEHLMNPRLFLEECAHLLKPTNGRLFLSTPKGKPHWLWSPGHFHEMYKHELLDLLDFAGFGVVRYECRHGVPWWSYLTGFRPLFWRLLICMGWLYNKTVFVEAKLKGV